MKPCYPTRTLTTWADIATKFPLAEAKWKATGPAYIEIGLEITQREGFPAELYAIEAHTKSPRKWWLGPSGWIHKGRELSELRSFAKPQFYSKPAALPFYSAYESSKLDGLKLKGLSPSLSFPVLNESWSPLLYEPYDPSKYERIVTHTDKPLERDLNDVYEELKGVVARMTASGIPAPLLVTSSNYHKISSKDPGVWYDGWRHSRYSTPSVATLLPLSVELDYSSDYCSSDLPTEASCVKASSKDTGEAAASTNVDLPKT